MVDDHLQNERTYCGSLALLEKGPLGFPIPSRDDEKTLGYAMPTATICAQWCSQAIVIVAVKPPLKSLNWFGKYLP